MSNTNAQSSLNDQVDNISGMNHNRIVGDNMFGAANASAATTTPLQFNYTGADIFRFANVSSISDAGTAFFKSLTEAVNECIATASTCNKQVVIKAATISQPNGLVVYTGRVAYGVFTEESFSSSVNTSDIRSDLSMFSANAPDLYGAMRRATGHVDNQGTVDHVFYPIIITQDDYPRYKMLANSIVGALLYSEGGVHMAALSEVANFSIVDDVTVANAFRNKVSPHGVQPRSDFGVLLRMQDRTANASNQNVPVPLASIHGYTSFVIPAGYNRAQPVVHITDIVAAMPAYQFFIPVLAAGITAISRKKLWLAPYSDFSTKGNVNIGNLTRSSNSKNGERFMVTSQAEFENFCSQFLMPEPIFVFDYDDGRFNLPYVREMFQSNDTLVSAFDLFMKGMPNVEADKLNGLNVGQVGGPVGNGWCTITGKASGHIDSRNIDFLNVVLFDPKNENLQMLTQVPNDEYMANSTRRLFVRNVHYIYKTVSYALNMNCINAAYAKTLAQYIRIESVSGNMFNFADFVNSNNSALYNGTNNAGAFGGFGNMYPFGGGASPFGNGRL